MQRPKGVASSSWEEIVVFFEDYGDPGNVLLK